MEPRDQKAKMRSQTDHRKQETSALTLEGRAPALDTGEVGQLEVLVSDNRNQHCLHRRHRDPPHHPRLVVRPSRHCIAWLIQAVALMPMKKKTLRRGLMSCGKCLRLEKAHGRLPPARRAELPVTDLVSLRCQLPGSLTSARGALPVNHALCLALLQRYSMRLRKF